jgi:hypothetical protein
MNKLTLDEVEKINMLLFVVGLMLSYMHGSLEPSQIAGTAHSAPCAN